MRRQCRTKHPCNCEYAEVLIVKLRTENEGDPFRCKCLSLQHTNITHEINKYWERGGVFQPREAEICKQFMGSRSGILTGCFTEGVRAEGAEAGDSLNIWRRPRRPKAAPRGNVSGRTSRRGQGRKKGWRSRGAAGKSAGEAKWQETRWMLDSGEPTCRISEDGTVDWGTGGGLKRYHAECHTCHGPNGLGSTFAPAPAVRRKQPATSGSRESCRTARPRPTR